MTKQDKAVLLAFLRRLEIGPSESDCDTDYDFGHSAGQERAYENLAEEFRAVLAKLKVSAVK